MTRAESWHNCEDAGLARCWLGSILETPYGSWAPPGVRPRMSSEQSQVCTQKRTPKRTKNTEQVYNQPKVTELLSLTKSSGWQLCNRAPGNTVSQPGYWGEKGRKRTPRSGVSWEDPRSQVQSLVFSDIQTWTYQPNGHSRKMQH